MSLTRRESSNGVKNDVSDGVVLSHESSAAAVSQGQHDAEPFKHHHDDDDETNKIFVARNGSMGVPNGKKGALSAKENTQPSFFSRHMHMCVTIIIMFMQAPSCLHRCMCILPSSEHRFLRYQRHLRGWVG
jgi:hypothetical protein